MSQFTLYANKDKGSNKTYPYFVDVQNNLMSQLNSRLVIPLSPISKVKDKVAKKLCPIIHVDDADFIVGLIDIQDLPKFKVL